MGIIEWASRRETPLQRRAFALLVAGARIRVPVIPILHHLLLAERQFRKGPLSLLGSKLYQEPLFRLQCESVGDGLTLFENMPKIMGNLRVRIGDGVKLNGEQVWIAAGGGEPRDLQIGSHTGIGHRCEFVVGESISIGDHVRIASRVTLNGYDGHPVDPFARARNDPPGPEGIGRITVMDYAWIGGDSTILKGVTIGRGAIVGARSVVKASVPDLTIVAGNPARVIWQVKAPESW